MREEFTFIRNITLADIQSLQLITHGRCDGMDAWNERQQEEDKQGKGQMLPMFQDGDLFAPGTG